MKKLKYTYIIILFLFSLNLLAQQNKLETFENSLFLSDFSKQYLVKKERNFINPIFQLANPSHIDSVICVSTNFKKKTIFKYENGLVIKRITFDPNENQIFTKDSVIYQGDKVIFHDQFRYDGKVLSRYARRLFNYNQNKLIANKVFEEWSNGKLTHKINKTYKYNSKLLISEIHNEDSWTYSEKSNKKTILYIEYNSKNEPSLKLNQKLSEGKMINDSKAEYFYFSNKFTEIKSLWVDEHWLPQKRITKKLNSSMEIINELTEIWSSEGWQYFTNIEYNYDKMGNQILFISKKWISNQWLNNQKSESEYNVLGYIVKKEDSIWENGLWKIYSKQNSTLHENNKISTISIKSTSLFEDSFTEIYIKRDSEGNELFNEYKVTYSNYEDYGWRTVRKFDNSNRLIVSESYWLNNGIWIPSYEGGVGFNIGPEYRFSTTGMKIYIYYKNGEEIFRVDLSPITQYALFQNYPNPFNPNTTISFSNSKLADITINLYNSLGQKIKTIENKEYPVGTHYLEVNSFGLASGTYFYRLEADGHTETKKMIILK